MINKEIESNLDLKLSLMKLSGIGGIKTENIIPLEIGSLSFCYLIKNTDCGDVVCKIDNEHKKPLLNQNNQIIHKNRQQETIDFQKKLAENTGITPNVFQLRNTNHIPEFINDIKVPQDIVGASIYFMQKVQGHHLLPNKNDYDWDKYYMKNYSKNDIEKMMSTTANMHKYSSKYLIENGFSKYNKFDVLSYENVSNIINNIGINTGNERGVDDNFFIEQTHFGEKLLKKRDILLKDLIKLINNDSKDITINLNRLFNKIKTKFSTDIQDKYRIDLSKNLMK